MTADRLRLVTQAGFAMVAGASYGFAIAGFGEARVAFVVLLILAGAAEWVEVRFGSLGGFTLRPMIAFLGLWSAGVSTFFIISLVPLTIMGIVKKESLPDKTEALPDVLASAGRDAVGLWIAYLVYMGLLTSAPHGWGYASALVAPAVSFVAYWAVEVPLRAFELSQTDGVRYGVGIRHLLRHAAGHVFVLTIVTVFLSFVTLDLGLYAMSIAAIAVIEAYFPWKLIGDQRGFLITSLEVMAQAVDLKDPYTSKHSKRVSGYAVRIARALGLGEEEVERIRIGGLMHDFGKIAISGRIIRKPSKLTPEEKALMDHHSTQSADIMERLEMLGESATMVRHHHEHRDGSGYPDGRKGEEIPLGSRIILVADAFDALTTDRPYRKGAAPAKAVAVIRESAGRQFDPLVVEVLERIWPSLQPPPAFRSLVGA